MSITPFQSDPTQRALNGRTIGLIVGDYIRMPPHYLRTAYIPVVKVRWTARTT